MYIINILKIYPYFRMSPNDVNEENLWNSFSTMFNEAIKSMYF